MKALLLGAIAAAALGFAPAFAADMPVKAPVVAPPSAYNWSGFYLASGLGGARWDIDGVLAAPLVPALTHNSQATRFNYASIAGAQYQFGNVVLGVEAAYNKLLGTSYAYTSGVSGDCLNNPVFAGFRCGSRVNNIWTIGGRVGWAWDRTLVFGTGGYANGRISSQTLNAAGGVVDQTNARHGGWFAGGGFEYFVTRFWMSDVILGAEYQHINLRSRLDVSSDGNPNDNRTYRANVDVVRARLVFKYGPTGVVVARD